MHDLPYQQDPNWKEILDQLSHIRIQGDYSPGHVDFIREQLTSFDDRVRGGAALAASGCLFEPYILDVVIDMAENDVNPAIRKAALQSLKEVIYEGVMQDLESQEGFSSSSDDADEWEEDQLEALREQYYRVKNILMNILQDDDEPGLQELALSSLADLGYLPEIRQKIEEFFRSGRKSSQLVALHAMGKFPQYWIEHLAELIQPETQVDLLKEAISASYSSQSAELAQAIEEVLIHKDPEVLRYAILTLANINKSKKLAEILQHFSLHENSGVQEAARDAIELIAKKNFERYIRDDLGMDDQLS